MGRRLIESTALHDPATGMVAFLPAGSEPPPWTAGRIGEHLFEVARSAPAEAAAPEPRTVAPTPTPLPGPPPRSGKGSSDAAWTAYARARGVPVAEEMKRFEVIAACTAAGVPTE